MNNTNYTAICPHCFEMGSHSELEEYGMSFRCPTCKKTFSAWTVVELLSQHLLAMEEVTESFRKGAASCSPQWQHHVCT